MNGNWLATVTWWPITLGLLSGLALGLIRALLGPTVYDRVLAVNYAGTLTVLLIAVLGYAQGRPDFLDIALLYALINFVATLAVLKYASRQDLGAEPR